jgi:hypothetical protein
MAEEENDVPYVVADAAAAVKQDLLPTLHFFKFAVLTKLLTHSF